MRKYRDLLVLSNLVYVIVGLIGLRMIGYYALPLLGVSVISTIYHKSGETKLKLRDEILAWITILVNSLLLLRD